ncbi:hypothetical protein EON64_02325 [archaeon]|nr:MAG: hypothetical protein EON64_02325 [archaeon]
MFGGTSSSVNIHTDNADKVVDNMVQRLQRLEDFIQADNADNDPFTPNRSSIRTKDKGMNAVIRIRKMEENLVALQERIGENEDEIQHVKDSLLQNHHRESSSPGRGRSPMKASQNQLDQSFQYGESARDVKDLERKIKKLAENTTRACKSLSAGLTDVQQATLNLYQWSDKVHNAVEIIGEKVQLPSNLCPRARVPSRNES